MLPIDYDLDTDNYHGERDVDNVPFPQIAPPSAARAAALLIKRYYAAASRYDGSAACALMYSPLAESVAEDYGPGAGTSRAHSETCASTAAYVFRRMGRQLRTDAATLKVTDVRVMGRAASARLSFDGDKPKYSMYLLRERKALKIGYVVASEQPIYVN